MISQSSVICWLNENKEMLNEELNIEVESLKGGAIKEVHTVEEDALVLEAFQHLLAHKVTGVGIVTKQSHKLVGSISVLDLLYCVEENLEFLELSVSEFVSKFRRQTTIPSLSFDSSSSSSSSSLFWNGNHKIVSCTPSSQLNDVIQTLVENKTHRIFVLDDEGHPIGVITLTDIMDIIVGLAVTQIFSILKEI